MERRGFWQEYRWTFLLGALPFVGFWLYGLFDLDEGFYAAVAAEMNRRGEWIIPYYNGEPWFEKPILLYWLAKPSIWLFGEMVGPRLPSVLASIGLYLLVAWFSTRRLSPQTGRLAILILAGSLLFVAAGRMMLTDPLLVLLLSGAFLTFWESLVGDRRWRLLTALLLGLSVLAKGPVGLILFAFPAGWTFWREPELRPAFRGYWVAGTLILLIVVASWYLPAYLRAGDLFVQKFLIEQNVGRFTGGDVAHKLEGPQNLVFYIAILLIGMLPYSLWVPRAWPLKARSDNPLLRYLAAWSTIVFVFFTLGGAKLPHYILPAVPPLAMLVAVHLGEGRKSLHWAGLWVVVIAVVENLGFMRYYAGELPGVTSHQEVHRLTRTARDLGLPLAIYQMSRRQADRGTGGLKIQETSHPSALFYLGRDALQTDDFKAVLSLRRPTLILTRIGRLDHEEERLAAAAGSRLTILERGRFYALARLD